jgi:hypothetical protein
MLSRRTQLKVTLFAGWFAGALLVVYFLWGLFSLVTLIPLHFKPDENLKELSGLLLWSYGAWLHAPGIFLLGLSIAVHVWLVKRLKATAKKS